MAGSETARSVTHGPDRIVLRSCAGIAELEACVRLQKEIWKFEDIDVVPLPLFVVAQKTGGQVLGAFDGDELVGFAMAVPGARGGHSYLHSHMLAVREAYRNAGLGRRLKWLQCREALTHGYELIEWTFDPLEIKNSHLNLVRLGAVAKRYNVNQYGCMSSVLQGGLPSDRLVAEWWLRSKRVESVLRTHALPPFTVEREIQIPGAIGQWKATPALHGQAEAVQLRLREQFQRAFGEGVIALGYQRDAQGNGTFLLGRWNESWSYAAPE